jgi:arylsulfatase A-like enzyme
MKKHLADYYATISALDHELGRILEAVKAAGVADNTVVVFTSDQGLAVGGRHGLMGKQNLYEHFKSPLVIAGTGVPNGSSAELVYLFDLFPTLCDFAKATHPKQIEGESLIPVMNAKKKLTRTHLFAAYKDVQRMVRDNTCKLMWYPKIDKLQLFDLSQDPDELKDVSGEKAYAEKLAELKTAMAREQKFWGDTIPLLK